MEGVKENAHFSLAKTRHSLIHRYLTGLTAVVFPDNGHALCSCN